MVFRRDSKVDAFQRQISALRHQLGGETDALPLTTRDDRSLGDQRHPPSTATISRPRYPGSESAVCRRAVLAIRRAPSPTSAGRTLPVPAIDTRPASSPIQRRGTAISNQAARSTSTARRRLADRARRYFHRRGGRSRSVIRAANVTVAGNVRGSIHCADRFEVLPHGKWPVMFVLRPSSIHDGALMAGRDRHDPIERRSRHNRRLYWCARWRQTATTDPGSRLSRPLTIGGRRIGPPPRLDGARTCENSPRPSLDWDRRRCASFETASLVDRHSAFDGTFAHSATSESKASSRAPCRARARYLSPRGPRSPPRSKLSTSRSRAT